MKYILVLFCLFLVGCKPNFNDNASNNADIAGNYLPNGSTNIAYLGNNWVTFDLEVGGTKRKFLYHLFSPGYNNGRESITELR